MRWRGWACQRQSLARARNAINRRSEEIACNEKRHQKQPATEMYRVFGPAVKQLHRIMAGRAVASGYPSSGGAPSPVRVESNAQW